MVYLCLPIKNGDLDDFPIKTSIPEFAMAMLNNQRVIPRAFFWDDWKSSP
jgi:hypothetical protein